MYIFVSIIVFALSVVFACTWFFVKKTKPESSPIERLFSGLLMVAGVLFCYSLGNHTTPYYKDVDPFIEACYTPIAFEFSAHLLYIHIVSLFAILILYFKGWKLPPIQSSLWVCTLVAGIIINIQFIYQISDHDMSQINQWKDNHATALLIGYPTLLTFISVVMIIKLIKEKSEMNSEFVYSNKTLNFFSSLIHRASSFTIISLLLSIPFLLIIILILTLFGQDADSFSKVYTETATWKFSEHIHPPPVDDRHGHYLCTVAAMGTPELVKPVGVGIRGSQPIIVNRQLQISNAFEYLIESHTPNLHGIIRSNYDDYGLNLSRRINNKCSSNITYILMKPLEWFFLITLYSFCQDPESLIREQYMK